MWEFVHDNRTKLLGFLGMALAQFGTSGIISNAKAISWCAFASSSITALLGFYNDWKAKKEAEKAAKDAQQT